MSPRSLRGIVRAKAVIWDVAAPDESCWNAYLMTQFDYVESHSLDQAVALLSQPGAVAMGGGTDLLPQVRDGVVTTERLVGLAAIPGMAAIAERRRRRAGHRRCCHHRRRCSASTCPPALRRAGRGVGRAGAGRRAGGNHPPQPGRRAVGDRQALRRPAPRVGGRR